ncbi:hypothetical protein BH09PSE6_BH09PSE6_03640 [soil metagenome]
MSALRALDAEFQSLVFSPRGEVEGFLVTHQGAVSQLVFDRHDEESPSLIRSLILGQKLKLKARPAEPSDKGPSEHAVFDFSELISIDGAPAMHSEADGDDGYEGIVVRLNYARHGAANGVILDTGDFVHLKPEGMSRLRLKVGDKVRAHGDATQLVTGDGWAVEAQTVNGRAVKGKQART